VDACPVATGGSETEQAVMNAAQATVPATMTSRLLRDTLAV
jgi:hypothetical protein